MSDTRAGAGTVALALAFFAAWSWAAELETMKATGGVELDDAAGDMNGIGTSDGEEPPLDTVHLKVASDGQRLTFEVTLAAAPGEFATSALDVWIDADNDAASGVEVRDLGGGFDYKLSLSSCVDYNNGGSACAGGMGSGAKAHWSAVNLDKLTDNSYSGDTVIDSMGLFGARASAKTPVTGKVLAGGIDYADIGAASGGTIRLLMRESGGTPKDEGYYPLVELQLK